MNIQLIYNDPGHQQRAAMMGMDMTAYVANMDPRAIQANIKNLSAGPAVYNTQEQVDNMRRVGANSGPNAFASSDQNNPMNEGMLAGPINRQSAVLGGDTVTGALSGPEIPVERPDIENLQAAPSQGEIPVHGQGITPPFEPQYPGDVPLNLTPQSDPVLTSGGTAAIPGALTSGAANTNAAVGATSAPRTNSGASSGVRQTATNNTGNARRSGMPDMRIGRSEQLGRIGTAMLGSAGNGLLASMNAGGNAMYSSIDANREAELAEYKNSERLRLEKAKAAAAARRGKGGKGNITNPYGSFGSQASQFNNIIKKLKADGNMTGPIAGTAGQYLDRSGYGNAERANLRLQMEGIALNEQLLFTERTKGAITDREMAMFRAPIPKITDDEGVWIAWLEPRAAVLNQLANNGISDAASASGGGGQTTAPAFNASDYTVVEITKK